MVAKKARTKALTDGDVVIGSHVSAPAAPAATGVSPPEAVAAEDLPTPKEALTGVFMQVRWQGENRRRPYCTRTAPVLHPYCTRTVAYVASLINSMYSTGSSTDNRFPEEDRQAEGVEGVMC